MSGPHPHVSVIVFSTTPLSEAPGCVATLTAQQRDGEPEIIVVDSADGEIPKRFAERGENVTFIRLPDEANIARMLGEALRRARGDILAITEATCAVDRNWVSAIEKAHEAPHPVIGGAVEPEQLRSALDWAAFFAEYGHFMLPIDEGVVDQVPGINLSVKRPALGRGREFVDGEFWKAFWCRRLQAEGTRLWLTPSVLVHYRKTFALRPFLARRFHHGRCFAAMRSRAWSAARRTLYAAGSPVLPFVFCARIVRSVAPKTRYRFELVRAFPHVVLATVSWAVGEGCGYLLGAGTSCREVK
jgi:glycosyl transferase family 2